MELFEGGSYFFDVSVEKGAIQWNRRLKKPLRGRNVSHQFLVFVWYSTRKYGKCGTAARQRWKSIQERRRTNSFHQLQVPSAGHRKAALGLCLENFFPSVLLSYPSQPFSFHSTLVITCTKDQGLGRASCEKLGEDFAPNCRSSSFLFG